MADIQVIGPDGKPYAVPEEKLEAFKSRGYTVETPDASYDRYKREEAASHPYVAGIEGFGRGISGGLSDVMSLDPEAVRLRKEENEVASVGGEVLGTVA